MPRCCSAISSSPVYQRKATKQNLCISDQWWNNQPQDPFHFHRLSCRVWVLVRGIPESRKDFLTKQQPLKKISILRPSGCTMRLCSPWRLAVPSSAVGSEYTMWLLAKNILFGCVCQNKLFLCFIPDLFVSQHPWEQTTKEALIRYSLYSWNESCN